MELNYTDIIDMQESLNKLLKELVNLLKARKALVTKSPSNQDDLDTVIYYIGVLTDKYNDLKIALDKTIRQVEELEQDQEKTREYINSMNYDF